MKSRLAHRYGLTILAGAVLFLLAGVAAPAFASPQTPQALWPSSQGDTFYGVAAAPSGDVYVTIPQEHRVERYSASGTLLGEWGTQGTGDGEFIQPKGITVAADGTVYVVDGTNARIQYFTAEGSYLGQWGGPGVGDGQFYGPEHVAVAPNGDVYVTDYGNHRVQYFDSGGLYLGQWGSHGSGSGEFDLPLGIAVAGDGTVYVSDLYNNRIEYFTADGEYLGEWTMQPPAIDQIAEGPHGIGVGPDGSVYAAVFFESRVERYSATGEFLGDVRVPTDDTQLGDPQSVAFSDEGTMYVIGYQGVHVYVETPEDVTPPEIAVPADIVVEASDASGAVVDFEVSAYDDVDGPVEAVVSHESGTLFPVGTTTVTVTAEDASGNYAARSFSVTVYYDTGPPVSGSGGSAEQGAETTVPAQAEPSLPPSTPPPQP